MDLPGGHAQLLQRAQQLGGQAGGPAQVDVTGDEVGHQTSQVPRRQRRGLVAGGSAGPGHQMDQGSRPGRGQGGEFPLEHRVRGPRDAVDHHGVDSRRQVLQ